MHETAALRADNGAAGMTVVRWLVAATFIVILNETTMMNALPPLMAAFEITARAAQWLSTAFMLTMAVVIPVTGWFLQRVTTRRAFTVAMTIFCAGTLVAALAPVFEVLLVARIIQAAGTAVMLPLLMTTLMTVVPEEDRGRVMGNVTLAISVAPALGPAVSGVLLHLGSWRLIFVVVLPIAVAIGLVGLRHLTDVGETSSGTLDQPSVLLAALGFGILVYGLSQIGAVAPALPAWVVILVGVAGVGAFVSRQLNLQRRGTPLLDLRTLTHRTYAIALVLMAVSFMAMIGSMVLLPLYLQEARGLSALQAGLMVMPGGLAMGLLGPTVGRLYDRIGARPLVLPGAIGMLAGLAVLTQAGLATPYWMILAAHLALMVSLAAVFTPVFTLGLGALPPQLYSHGSSLLGTLQQVAAAMGTAVVITVMSTRARMLTDSGTADLDALAGGLRWGFGVGVVLGVVAVVVALLVPSRTDDPGTAGAGGPDVVEAEPRSPAPSSETC